MGLLGTRKGRWRRERERERERKNNTYNALAVTCDSLVPFALAVFLLLDLLVLDLLGFVGASFVVCREQYVSGRMSNKGVIRAMCWNK